MAVVVALGLLLAWLAVALESSAAAPVVLAVVAVVAMVAAVCPAAAVAAVLSMPVLIR